MFRPLGASERSIPLGTVLLERLTVPLPVNKRPAFYEPVSSLPCSQETATCHGEPDQSRSRPRATSCSSILVLPSHLCLGLPSGLFQSGFPNKTPYAPLLSAIRVTCPDPLILVDLIARMIFGEESTPFSSLCIYVRSPCYVFPLTTKYLPQKPVIQHPHLTFVP
jgi:hypothetical protein